MKRSPQSPSFAQGPRCFSTVLRCRCRAALAYLAGVIRRYRRQIGSCWRKCNPGQQALLVLAHLRKGETFAELAAGFGAGTATAWRYVRETVALLAARAPKLPAALAAAKRPGTRSWSSTSHSSHRPRGG